jgi:acetoin utilization deacetylase AcuC-like enzyme
VLAYGLHKKMNIYEPHRASFNEMTLFHSPDYIKHLKMVSPAVYSDLARKNVYDILNESNHFSIGHSDCPAFPGCFELAQIATGGSMDAAIMLNHKLADVCINWSGGLHHARKEQASGFCYVNDIVCAIIELLKYHNRVLYIDIDVHHGDGVEEAFYTTNRVMTVSFHRYGDGFFPGTGDLLEVGCGEGKYFSLNVPLKENVNDQQFENVFTSIMEEVRNHYRPDVVVLQCGADALAWDRLGTHNTTIRAHGSCV